MIGVADPVAAADEAVRQAEAEHQRIQTLLDDDVDSEQNLCDARAALAGLPALDAALISPGTVLENLQEYADARSRAVERIEQAERGLADRRAQYGDRQQLGEFYHAAADAAVQARVAQAKARMRERVRAVLDTCYAAEKADADARAEAERSKPLLGADALRGLLPWGTFEVENNPRAPMTAMARVRKSIFGSTRVAAALAYGPDILRDGDPLRDRDLLERARREGFSPTVLYYQAP
jgi:hypothetical protein